MAGLFLHAGGASRFNFLLQSSDAVHQPSHQAFRTAKLLTG
jgi:hypothetical protein